MKKVLIFLVSLSFFACEKEYIYPSDGYPIPKKDTTNQPTINPWGKFIVIDGKMYITNHETGEKTVFSHFDTNKNTSSLRWGGSYFEIEELEINKTTYSFYRPKSTPGYGNFILNNDTSKHYEVWWTLRNSSIIEDPIHPQSLLGGSSRPFQGYTLNYTDSLITMYIQEVEGSIGGYNCNYYTILTLKKIQSW
jgi:hypothetical protein